MGKQRMGRGTIGYPGTAERLSQANTSTVFDSLDIQRRWNIQAIWYYQIRFRDLMSS